MRWLRSALFLFLMVFLCSPDTWALTVLKGADAEQHIGQIKAHILSGKYSFDILSRSHRDAMHGRFSDGVIFNAGGGKFQYLRRKDGRYTVVLNDPSGREKDLVTEDNWHHLIENALSDDNNLHYVFLNDAGNELAILCVGRGTDVSYKLNDQGLLRISLDIPGTGGRSGEH